MCIIIYKPYDVAPPTEEVINKCWQGNSQGAGLMIRQKSGVYYEKGFMTLKGLKSALANLNPQLEWGIHFRLATHGGVNKECTHPFPLVDGLLQMRVLKGSAKTCVMHNGIFDLKGGATFSDTMEWVQLVASLGLDHRYEDHAKALDLMSSGQRVLIMSEDCVTLHGTWEKDNSTGLYYSNTGYRGYATRWSYEPASSAWYDKDDDDDDDKKGKGKKKKKGKSEWNKYGVYPRYEESCDCCCKISGDVKEYDSVFMLLCDECAMAYGEYVPYAEDLEDEEEEKAYEVQCKNMPF
jgi:hypothetical protein